MMQVPFALYDAFSDTAFGGSPAGVVSHAEGLGALSDLVANVA